MKEDERITYVDNWASQKICKGCHNFCNFRCRRHAPTREGWPAVFDTDWCGDFKMSKETMRGKL